jgi:hypothetical protein
MRVPKFALEHTPLLFFHAASRFQRKPHDPFYVRIGNRRSRIWMQKLHEAADRLSDGFDVAA